MKKLLLAGLFLSCTAVQAANVHERQWGVPTSINLSLPDFDNPGALATNADVAFASGDVTYTCDDGTVANIETDVGAGTEALPTEEGTVFFTQSLTAIQMRCARLVITYADQSGPKIWMDTQVIIETTGCHLAQNPGNVVRCGTAQAGGTQTLTLDAGASSVTDAYRKLAARIIAGTGAGQGDRVISAYNGTSKIANLTDAWVITPDSTSVFQVFSPLNPIVATDVNGVVRANPVMFNDDVTAGGNAENFFNNTGFNASNSTIGAVTNVTNIPDLSTTQINAIRDAIVTHSIESGIDLECALALMVSYTSGPWLNSGSGNLTTTYRDPGDNVNRIVVTRDVNGNFVSIDSFACP